MGIVYRIILSIYTLFLAFLSMGVILLSLRLISLDDVGTSISQISKTMGSWFGRSCFLLVSIRLLLAGMRSRRIKDTIVHHNEMGDVHISRYKKLVEKTVAIHVGYEV